MVMSSIMNTMTALGSAFKGATNNSLGQAKNEATSAMTTASNNKAARNASLQEDGAKGMKGLNQSAARTAERDNDEQLSTVSRQKTSDTKLQLGIARLEQLASHTKMVATMMTSGARAAADLVR
jgi:hypothetical protein